MQAMVLERDRGGGNGPAAAARRAHARAGAGRTAAATSIAAPSAAPICTWSRAICRGGKCPSSPATRPSASSINWGRAAAEHLPSATRAGIAWLRSTCGQCEYCAAGRENLCEQTQLHRLSRRRRLRRICRGARGLRLRDPRRLQRRRGGAAAVRGHHRLSRAGAGQSAPRRNTGHVRLRLLRPRADPDRPAPRLPGLRGHPRGAAPRVGPADGGGLGGGRRGRHAACGPTARSSSPRRASWCCRRWRR